MIKYAAKVKRYKIPLLGETDIVPKEKVEVELEDRSIVETQLLVGADGFRWRTKLPCRGDQFQLFAGLSSVRVSAVTTTAGTILRWAWWRLSTSTPSPTPTPRPGRGVTLGCPRQYSVTSVNLTETSAASNPVHIPSVGWRFEWNPAVHDHSEHQHSRGPTPQDRLGQTGPRPGESGLHRRCQPSRTSAGADLDILSHRHHQPCEGGETGGPPR